MKVELLAPAGNRAKLNTALYFGADAAYVGGKAFSQRSFADNFVLPELGSPILSALRRLSMGPLATSTPAPAACVPTR